MEVTPKTVRRGDRKIGMLLVEDDEDAQDRNTRKRLVKRRKFEQHKGVRCDKI